MVIHCFSSLINIKHQFKFNLNGVCKLKWVGLYSAHGGLIERENLTFADQSHMIGMCRVDLVKLEQQG